MRITASKLRESVYNLLDQVLESGVPLEIERKGRVLKIVPDQRRTILDRVIRRDYIVGNPDDIVSVDWTAEWNAGRDLAK